MHLFFQCFLGSFGITAPAQSHATDSAMYTALFFERERYGSDSQTAKTICRKSDGWMNMRHRERETRKIEDASLAFWPCFLLLTPLQLQLQCKSAYAQFLKSKISFIVSRKQNVTTGAISDAVSVAVSMSRAPVEHS